MDMNLLFDPSEEELEINDIYRGGDDCDWEEDFDDPYKGDELDEANINNIDNSKMYD